MIEDFRDFLRALKRAEVRFLVVGAHALSIHGVPRATGDLDVWVEREVRNAKRVMEALIAFGGRPLVRDERARARGFFHRSVSDAEKQ